MVLHGFSCWPSIKAQVLDGPPGFTTRRLSSFLLIPVGIHRQGFAFWAFAFRCEFSKKSCFQAHQSQMTNDSHDSSIPHRVTAAAGPEPRFCRRSCGISICFPEVMALRAAPRLP
jgi:hypothetical protein